jgi:glycosyltransferase involved in cell wall biosynthesis
MHVYFLQGLVPHYRVPFFRRLASRPEFTLEVHASPEVPGQSLRTAAECLTRPPFPCHMHPCTALAGGRLFWQADLWLPRHFGRGDVFVLPGAPRFVRSFALAAEARARGAAVVWFSQGFGVGATPVRVAARHVAARLCQHAVLYTQTEVDAYVARGFPPERITAMNNALDQAPIRAAAAGVTPAAVAALRAAHGLEGRRVLLCVGRLTAKTEAPVLVEAIERLPAEYVAVFIGGGEDTPVVQAHVAERRLEARVRLLGPLYDEPALAPWFALSEVFVYPGGIGLSILHAFGHGLPVVTHDEPAAQMPEFAALRPGVNGELFPRGDATALARVLRAVCESPERRSRLAAGARETVTTGWNIDDMVERFAAALRVAARR